MGTHFGNTPRLPALPSARAESEFPIQEEDTGERCHGCQLKVKTSQIANRGRAQNTLSSTGNPPSQIADSTPNDSRRLGLDRSLVHQHDGNVVLHRIYPAALRALQALRILPVLERLLARRTNQNLQQILGNHGKDCTPHKAKLIHPGDTKARRKPRSGFLMSRRLSSGTQTRSVFSVLCDSAVKCFPHLGQCKIF